MFSSIVPELDDLLSPMHESERWRAGSTHSTCGWKSRIAASKSRLL